MFPKLLHERMPEIGMDYAVIYPSLGMMYPHIDESSEGKSAVL